MGQELAKVVESPLSPFILLRPHPNLSVQFPTIFHGHRLSATLFVPYCFSRIWR